MLEMTIKAEDIREGDILLPETGETDPTNPPREIRTVEGTEDGDTTVTVDGLDWPWVLTGEVTVWRGE